MADGRCGLPKACRLLKPPQFKSVIERGNRIRDEYFSVFSAPNNGGPGRLGITVSRRASPKAVVRNRIKRQTRESFRRSQGELAGIDIVVIAHTKAATAETSALRGSLGIIWEKTTQRCKKF